MMTALVAAMFIAVSYPPSRHLVYGFNIDTAAIPRPTLESGKSDTGTIHVDVVQVQADTGTIVSVSEDSHSKQNVKPATCITYGTGLVMCNPIQNVTVEEMCLLRLLGRNFLNWSEIDEHHKWHNGEFDGRSRETNDYRITGQTNGLFDIAFERVLNVPGPDGYTATTKGRLSYNQSRSAPTALTQETVMQPQDGGHDSIVEELTLTLVSDSLRRCPGNPGHLKPWVSRPKAERKPYAQIAVHRGADRLDSQGA